MYGDGGVDGNGATDWNGDGGVILHGAMNGDVDGAGADVREKIHTLHELSFRVDVHLLPKNDRGLLAHHLAFAFDLLAPLQTRAVCSPSHRRTHLRLRLKKMNSARTTSHRYLCYSTYAREVSLRFLPRRLALASRVVLFGTKHEPTRRGCRSSTKQEWLP